VKQKPFTAVSPHYGHLLAEIKARVRAAQIRAGLPDVPTPRDRGLQRAQVRHDWRPEDREFVTALAQAILQRHPGCPTDEARRIAEHTGRRSSGRVGRSAAGRALDASAVDLAVIAHIRHEHTNYDELLMCGTKRLDARVLVREKIDRVLAEWSGR
jgi:hypothetical protein